MKANLIQRVALGVGAVISLAGISGCTEEEARIGSFLGTVGIMNPNSTPKEAALWGGVRQASQDSLNSYNAEKSRTNVNVYNNSNEPEMTNKFTIISNINGKEVVIDSWAYKEYIKEHTEDYVDGYKVELHGNGRWQAVHTTGKMRNR